MGDMVEVTRMDSKDSKDDLRLNDSKARCKGRLC